MIFRRALQREFTHAAAAVFIALFAVLITVVLLRLLGQAAGGRVPADAVFALIGFGSLSELPIVLTLTVFIGVLVSLSRSYRDSEMVVWFASGAPLTAWIVPVVRFALPLALVIAGVTLFLGPWSQQKNAEYREQLESRDDTQRVAPGVFRESSGGRRRVFFVEAGAGLESQVRNVFVSEERDDKLAVIVASEGFLRSDEKGNRYVVLQHGWRYDGRPGTPEFRVMNFERYQSRIESNQQSAGPAKTRSKPTRELLQEPTSRNLAELTFRIGMPLAALVLALLAIPLSFVNPRAGRTNNLLMALFIFMIYYHALLVCQSWVSQGRLHFAQGVVLPHLLALVLLAVLFYRRLVVTPFWRSQALRPLLRRAGAASHPGAGGKP
jgi:lipopolysaccharide export system permease protein